MELYLYIEVLVYPKSMYTYWHYFINLKYLSTPAIIKSSKYHLLYPCRDVMTLPTLKGHIYKALEHIPGNQTRHMILIEAKLNVLHTTYLALLSEPKLDEDLLLKGMQVFQTLFSRHFAETQEVCVWERGKESRGGEMEGGEGGGGKRERERNRQTERERERESGTLN